jgi:prepilin-type N-terminal cleavage/methylation domain-containing protein
MMKKLRKIINAQSGFSMIEMLVAIAIGGLIIALIVDVTAQTLIINAADSSRMGAVKQVENAIHWMERDGQMANSEMITPADSTVTDFPLVLQWTSFEDGYVHTITYNREEGSGVLTRDEIIDKGGKEDPVTTQTMICDNVVSASYLFNGKILEVDLTAHVSDYRSATETRTLYVVPRVGN